MKSRSQYAGQTFLQVRIKELLTQHGRLSSTAIGELTKSSEAHRRNTLNRLTRAGELVVVDYVPPEAQGAHTRVYALAGPGVEAMPPPKRKPSKEHQAKFRERNRETIREYARLYAMHRREEELRFAAAFVFGLTKRSKREIPDIQTQHVVRHNLCVEADIEGECSGD